MNLTKLTEFIDSLPAHGVPGCWCIVHKDGKEIFNHAAGYSDRENNIPAGRGEINNLYSVSKVATCTAGMQLIERGLILPADPVYFYLPEFAPDQLTVRSADGVVPCRETMRVRDLFSMTAGFDYSLDTTAISEAKEATGGKAPTREIVKAFAKRPLSFQPGTMWQYSLCHDVLGALIEVVTGTDLEDYMQENIFGPLGMENTGFILTPEMEKHFSPQYCYSDEKQYAELISNDNSFRVGPDYRSGGAGLYSSADQYIKLAAALSRGGLGENGNRILRPDTVDMMRTNRLKDNMYQNFNWSQLAGYGYGFGVRTMVAPGANGCYGSVGEFGWGGAAGAYLLADPSEQLSVFYSQHMLNNMEPYIHPRIRNFLYQGLREV